MKRSKELILNSLIFAFGNIGTKFILFFLIPIHTSVLSTKEYGIADLLNTTISLLFPILTLGFSESIMRYIISKKTNAKSMLVSGLFFSLVGTLLTGVIALIALQVGILAEYAPYLPILFFANALHRMLQQYSKGLEMNLWYALDGIIGGILQLVLTILFMLVYPWGIRGYLLALIVSYLLSSLVLILACRIPKTLREGQLDRQEIRAATHFGLPLMAEEVSWWVIQGSDRYMVAWLCGAAANGIYSVAYKIPALFNVLVTVFIQALSVTAYKELDEQELVDGKVDASAFNTIYQYYLAATFLAAIAVILVTKPLAVFILKNDFFQSWTYTPILLCAFAVGNLQNFYGTIYKGLKKSKQIFISTLIAALTNIVLNWVLIQWMGPMGAGVASLISYIVIYVIRLVDIQRFIRMEHRIARTALSITLLILISISYTYEHWLSYLICSLLIMAMVYIYRSECLGLLKMGKATLARYIRRT